MCGMKDLEGTPKSEHVRRERLKNWCDSPTQTPLTASGLCRRVFPLLHGTAGPGEGWVLGGSDTQDGAEAEQRRVYYLRGQEGNTTGSRFDSRGLHLLFSSLYNEFYSVQESPAAFVDYFHLDFFFFIILVLFF